MNRVHFTKKWSLQIRGVQIQSKFKGLEFFKIFESLKILSMNFYEIKFLNKIFSNSTYLKFNIKKLKFTCTIKAR